LNIPASTLKNLVFILVLGAQMLFAGLIPAQNKPAALDAAPVPGPRVDYVADPQPSTFFQSAPAAFLNSLHAPSQALSSIQYDYLTTGSSLFGYACSPVPAAVQSSFAEAGSIWTSLLTSNVPIKIQVCWTYSLGGSILGSSSSYIMQDAALPNPNVYYPSSLGDAFFNSDYYAGYPDIMIAFNANFDTGAQFYYGSGDSPSNQYNFTTLALHEIGHGLGMMGGMTVSSGSGSWTYQYIYDTFTEDSAGTKLFSYTSPSLALGTTLQSAVYFNGSNAQAGNGGSRVQLFTPATWRQGSSYSHVAESFNSTSNALMTYSLSPGEDNYDPGPVVMGILKDIGWNPPVSNTPTWTPTDTSTNTPANTATPAHTATHTATNTATSTATATNTATNTPTSTPTPTPSATSPPTPGVSPTPGSPNSPLDNFVYLPALAVGIEP
jgi:hypothetical protein